MPTPLSKKGFVFSLDVALGMMVFFIVIGTSMYFMTRASESPLPSYQMLALGSDIVHILDEKETFDLFDPNAIETEMEKLLPTQYGMLIRVEGNITFGNGTLEAGLDVPPRVSILAGQRVALTNQERYMKITYFMWSRQQE